MLVLVPLQMFAALLVAVNVGLGSTLMVNVFTAPLHAPYRGVTVIVAVTGLVPLFTDVNAAMLPVPLAGSPIEGVSLVQVKLVAVPVNDTAAVLLPLQSSWLPIAVTTGVGCTVMVKVFVGPA